MLFKSCTKTIGDAVEKLILSKYGRNNINKLEVLLFLNWKVIVGKEISKIAQPKKLLFLDSVNTGVLYLIVNNGGVAVDIQYAIPVIIEKISVFFGFKVVHGIKIKQQA
ncbi:DUF721 domain-containing protein [Ehrlichia minasensis]|uniref:DUF721 domain-containing protein n=1 Tax=Ehrlichia minasensis TaxID=1242993 RepID=A0A4Q6I5E0_9RICK|nr:DUF721 domain-containing protein [Ehrlichia minasensis]RZB12373.1 DUF721 domain-containing protein [Ehrlichia minasensis]CEI85418.1 Conserved domain protein [Ehrlichia minasensis]